MEGRIVYIAGPITGLPNLNKEQFAAAATKVKQLGLIVRNPHELCADLPIDTAWKTYMKRCISHLVECTDIVLLPNWGRSDGANLEFQIAKALGIQIHNSLDHLVWTVEAENKTTL